uniref:Centrosomal protein of 97 kDa n=1 Tax=Timema monikensis TaxID=170555 RepID=A0A7R9ECV1_9NEOP|nr:unnamed protein product [Timema monikensis]
MYRGFKHLGRITSATYKSAVTLTPFSRETSTTHGSSEHINTPLTLNKKNKTVSSEEQQETLDLSNQGIKKLNKAQPNHAHVTNLILDGNELQRWDNIDSYSELTKLSATNNQLLRMYGVSRLHNLTSLNLAHNNILTIEGLKDLVQLRWLCLSANNIKTIEHLNTNLNLEHLDLSENSISHISDLSYLKNIKELLLHNNHISQLRQCERYLPPSLVTLTLATNNLTDLNEMSHLAHLTNLREFSLANNPCVTMTGNTSASGFDYRPFVINWCMSLKVIDGYMVDAIESLKAEWLYSQGRGRQFRSGEHQALSQYLVSVCPLSGDSLESEEERKLRLILSKAQHHQQQLREQLTVNGNGVRGRGAVLNRSQSSPAPSPATRRRLCGKNNSPRRISMSREVRTDVGRPDRMVASCHGTVGSAENDVAGLMSRSLDPTLLFSDANHLHDSVPSDVPEEQLLEATSQETEANEVGGSFPLQTATKLVPVPESLMSPDYRPMAPPSSKVLLRPKSAVVNGRKSSVVSRVSPKLCRSALHSSPLPRPRSMGDARLSPRPATGQPRRKPNTHTQVPDFTCKLDPLEARKMIRHHHDPTISSDEDSEMSASKLETIRHRAQERWQRKDTVNTVNNSVATRAVEVNYAAPDTAAAVEQAAVCIQRIWRGYHTRNLNKHVQGIYQDLHSTRTQEYIEKLSSDMESTRVALESEHKLQLLQMQAISALWKKAINTLRKKVSLHNLQLLLIQAINTLRKKVSLHKLQLLQIQAISTLRKKVSLHKLQLLLMKAISAPWKKVVSLQPAGKDGRTDVVAGPSSTCKDTEAVRELTETCSRLHLQACKSQEDDDKTQSEENDDEFWDMSTVDEEEGLDEQVPDSAPSPDEEAIVKRLRNLKRPALLTSVLSILIQVEQLQDSMQSVMQHMSKFCQAPNNLSCAPIATQTDIVAVHTPQSEAGIQFPYQRTRQTSSRPSSLPIPQRGVPKTTSDTVAPQEVRQFATSLVDGVMKTVSENRSEQGDGPDDNSGSVPNSGCADQESTDAGTTLGTESGDSSNGNAIVELEDNNTSCLTIHRQSPSSGNSPYEPNSPNNNQRPQEHPLPAVINSLEAP